MSNDFKNSISLAVTEGISSPIQFFFELVSLSIYLLEEKVLETRRTIEAISFYFIPGSDTHCNNVALDTQIISFRLKIDAPTNIVASNKYAENSRPLRGKTPFSS